MSKAGKRILKGAHEALGYARGETVEGFVVHAPETVDVKEIRLRLGMTQAEFALRYGFKVNAVRNWEQGRRRPEGPTRMLLKIIEREPQAVDRALTV